MSRDSFKVLALVACSLTAALLLAEAVLRVLPDREQALSRHREVIGGPLHQRDPLLGWRTVPHAQATLQSREYRISVHNNSRGIRGPEYPYAAETSEYRILIIGDSFTAGYTVEFEETFGQIAQRNLNAQGTQKYNVIAAGTEAYSTDQELLFFVEEGWKYQPNITVLMLFFNDVWYNTQPFYGGEEFGSKPFFVLEGRKPVLASKPDSALGSPASQPASGQARQDSKDASVTLATKRWLNSHSRLYRLVRQVATGRLDLAAIPLRDVWFQYPLLDMYRVFEVSHNEDTRRAWALTEALIVQLAEEVAQRGGRLVLFHVPSRESVYDDVWKRAMSFHALKDSEWQADRVEVELRRICSDNGLDCVLPTARFREQAAKLAPQRLYLVGDPHWTREGHELVGSILAEHIQKRYPGSPMKQTFR